MSLCRLVSVCWKLLSWICWKLRSAINFVGNVGHCFCLWSCTVSDDQDPVADKKDLNFCLLHFKFLLNPYHILAGTTDAIKFRLSCDGSRHNVL
jgi:hypothetical protein